MCSSAGSTSILLVLVSQRSLESHQVLVVTSVPACLELLMWSQWAGGARVAGSVLFLSRCGWQNWVGEEWVGASTTGSYPPRQEVILTSKSLKTSLL